MESAATVKVPLVHDDSRNNRLRMNPHVDEVLSHQSKLRKPVNSIKNPVAFLIPKQIDRKRHIRLEDTKILMRRSIRRGQGFAGRNIEQHPPTRHR
jgi:hypothetical protein